MAEAAVTTRLKKLINTPETEVKEAMAEDAPAEMDPDFEPGRPSRSRST